ncbi:MAG: hypothetical protein C0398_07135 [Coprothermobacter sp.]|jgi:hypothetical protein|nr:hypothetical protein [Coprothermobacter sp.]
MFLAALVVIVACTGVVRAQPVETAIPADARIQRLLDLHILLGAPDGDLQLERQANGGEFVVLLERVLQQPESTSQSLGTPSEGGEANGWIRAYAWTRGVWDRVLYVRGKIRHVWFGLRYRLVEGSGWGIERSHWMFTSLRDAYLDGGLIDLSFQPKKRMSGSEGINMLLTAAGFGGEVAAMQAQMNDPVGDEALRVVCRQHGLDNVMDYAGKPLTRRGAALLAWRLLAERTGSD